LTKKVITNVSEEKNMNATQNAKSKMYRATENHCLENNEITKNMPAFVAAFNNFKAIILEIDATTQKTSSVLKGIATDKNASRESLGLKATGIAGMIFAYASATANNTLKQEVNFSVSRMTRGNEDQFISRCRNIHTKGVENIAVLPDYGITNQTLSDLQTAIDEYIAKSPKTRTAKSNRKTMNANLTALFKQADTVLKEQMDKLIVAFRADHPDFVKTYEANRIIVDAGSTATQLKGKVTGQADGLPIKDVTVKVVEANLTVLTDAKGEYLVKPIIVGKYTVTFSKEGFTSREIDDVDAKKGAVNVLNMAI
jgi:Carboxypeptidase regulatory-like domain